jgi:putative oxidoreductase
VVGERSRDPTTTTHRLVFGPLLPCEHVAVSDLDAMNLAMLLFRCGLGAVMIAHGYNHIYGGGKIEGTAAWFGSMGMRPPLLQAWLASITELGAGALLVLGLLTPFGGAGIVGVMVVAWAINHRGNGFFIFRPGEGWEYVMTLAICGIAVGTIGPGEWSLDEAFGLDDDLVGVPGLLIAAVAGGGGAAALLAACWRKPASS